MLETRLKVCVLLAVALLGGAVQADSISGETRKGRSDFTPDPHYKRQEIVIISTVQPRIAYRPFNPNNQTVGVDLSPSVVDGTAAIAPELASDSVLASGSAGHAVQGSIGQGVANLVGAGLTAALVGEHQAPAVTGGGLANIGTAGIAGMVGGALSPITHLAH